MGDEKTMNSRHRITLDDRERMSIVGVNEVISFDEEAITADTDQGIILIKGEGLHITKLNLDDGILQTEGLVECIEYTEESSFSNSSKSLFGRIFK